MLNIGNNDPLRVTVRKAIHSGDLDGLRRLLDGNPGLATARIDGRTLLHVVADWPGHFPNGAAVVTALIAAGADPNASALENSTDSQDRNDLVEWLRGQGGSQVSQKTELMRHRAIA